MYKVYFTNEWDQANSYTVESLNEALSIAAGLRKSTRHSFVTIVSENPDVVGKAGVDSVVDGKLPDGNNYEWKKRR